MPKEWETSTSMRDLAPHILRQRLLIEGLYGIDVDTETVLRFFQTLIEGLGMTQAGEPIVNTSEGLGKPENRGIEAFMPLIESGIVLYTWESSRFLSLIVYTCKSYDNQLACDISREFFKLTDIESKSF